MEVSVIVANAFDFDESLGVLVHFEEDFTGMLELLLVASESVGVDMADGEACFDHIELEFELFEFGVGDLELVVGLVVALELDCVGLVLFVCVLALIYEVEASLQIVF